MPVNSEATALRSKKGIINSLSQGRIQPVGGIARKIMTPAFPTSGRT